MELTEQANSNTIASFFLGYLAFPGIQQQQHSLLSQASWGRLEMKPTEKQVKRNTKGHKTEGRVSGE
jgi:hypothetical protein